MIRINLLRNLGAPSVNTQAFQTSTVMESDVRSTAMKKLLVLLLFPAIPFAYDQVLTSIKEGELKKKLAEVAAIENERNSLGPVAEMVSKYSSEKRLLEAQLAMLGNVTKDRLREVKALDAIQTLVPPKTWLKDLRINNGQVEMTGYSQSDLGVPELIKALETNVLFSEISIVSTANEQIEIGSVKRFELVMKVGKP